MLWNGALSKARRMGGHKYSFLLCGNSQEGKGLI